MLWIRQSERPRAAGCPPELAALDCGPDVLHSCRSRAHGGTEVAVEPPVVESLFIHASDHANRPWLTHGASTHSYQHAERRAGSWLNSERRLSRCHQAVSGTQQSDVVRVTTMAIPSLCGPCVWSNNHGHVAARKPRGHHLCTSSQCKKLTLRCAAAACCMCTLRPVLPVSKGVVIADVVVCCPKTRGCERPPSQHSPARVPA